jgi:hypothetical protein
MMLLQLYERQSTENSNYFVQFKYPLQTNQGILCSGIVLSK